MSRLFLLLVSCALLALPALASDAAAEIEFLLSTIGSSECSFTRNGKRHDATDAEAHLRMKYKRGRRYADTAERFVERLASKSSMTRKQYLIECPGAEPVPSGDWLMSKLETYRNDGPSPN